MLHPKTIRRTHRLQTKYLHCIESKKYLAIFLVDECVKLQRFYVIKRRWRNRIALVETSIFTQWAFTSCEHRISHEKLARVHIEWSAELVQPIRIVSDTLSEAIDGNRWCHLFSNQLDWLLLFSEMHFWWLTTSGDLTLIHSSYAVFFSFIWNKQRRTLYSLIELDENSENVPALLHTLHFQRLRPDQCSTDGWRQQSLIDKYVEDPSFIKLSGLCYCSLSLCLGIAVAEHVPNLILDYPEKNTSGPSTTEKTLIR